MDKENIAWTAPEYDYEHREPAWYLVSILVAAVLLILALWQKNFLFAAFVLLAEMAIILGAKQLPPVWDFEISGGGVKIGEKKFFGYADIEGFDIHPDTEDYHHLVLRVRSRFSPDVKIRMPVSESEKIETRLAKTLQRQSYE